MMKFIFTNLFISLFVFSLSAQNFVSTTAENKNVVLEEFTGIYCTFCPDGHLRATQLATNNPGDVFLVNIHAGSYAAPSGGDPDFRTPFGAAIAGQSGLAGYPAGTINRRNFAGLEQGNPGTTALGRGNWAPAAPIVLAEASSVNIAAEAYVDPITRELKVIVETYYTGNATASSHKLNVALTQNNIEGPQTGSGANPSSVLANGNYNHQHMLRHMLTGQWGTDITTTTMGYFQVDTLTYVLPGAINGIGVAVGDLDVVVFVTEGQQNILTGNATAVVVNIPPGYVAGDLGITNSATAPAGYCSATFTPSVNVVNEGSTTINSYAVTYSINGGTPVSQTINTAIMAGQTASVSFPVATLSGTSTINYEVEFVSLNANMLELVTGNNTTADGPYALLDPSFNFGANFVEGFENNVILDEAPANAIADNPDGIRAYVMNQGGTSITYDIGGNGNSANSFRWDFYDIAAGGTSMVIFEEIDLSSVVGAFLDFSYAYAQYTTENDKLEVLISTNCGQSWTTLFDKEGSALSTVPAQTGRFYPQANQWSDESINLIPFVGNSDLVIAFKGTSAYGNSLYFDDVNVSSSVNTNEAIALEGMKVFPNPASDLVNIQFNLAAAQEMNISISNALGQTVKQVNTGNLNAGQQDFAVNTANLAAGMYFINFTDGQNVMTERFVVAK